MVCNSNYYTFILTVIRNQEPSLRKFEKIQFYVHLFLDKFTNLFLVMYIVNSNNYLVKFLFKLIIIHDLPIKLPKKLDQLGSIAWMIIKPLLFNIILHKFKVKLLKMQQYHTISWLAIFVIQKHLIKCIHRAKSKKFAQDPILKFS